VAADQAAEPANDAPPPWITRQLTGLLQQRGHAWLLAGPSGLGQYRLALEMVRAWLCDQTPRDGAPAGACGHCASCHAIDVRAHTDLLVLMPETILLELGWPLSEDAQKKIDDKERKPSKEIRVEALRDAVEFAQRTSGRGRGKAVLVYPAERMNAISANTLLKTLEEPPGDLRFVLASESAHQLLPTIRSRCLGHAMVWPGEQESLAWLAGQGLSPAQAATLLRAAGGRPQDAGDAFANGMQAAAWEALPKAMQRGDLAPFKDWAAPQVVDALQKICHDLSAVKAGALPRFFSAQSLPEVPTNKPGASQQARALDKWSQSLAATRRTVEHPFNAGLMLEALVAEAKTAINSR
jgi:DNA polymerase III subunit delta'